MGISYRVVTALVSLVAFTIATASMAQKKQAATPRASTQPQGRQIFASSCAACHGLDGHGGERAPNIVTSAEVQKLSDTDLFRILQNGIAGAGMPSFSSLGAAQIKQVVAYLRVLQGKGGVAALPGDPRLGQLLFTGKGRCSECHMVNGQGGFLASDLSTYAAGRSVDDIRAAILDPAKDPERSHNRAIVVTNAGAEIEGIVRNEDNFSIALQTRDGAYHLMKRSDLQRVDYVTEPFMPSNYSSILNATEINGLISYLMTLPGRNGPADAKAPARQGHHDDD